MTETSDWFRDFQKTLKANLRDETAQELAIRIHRALVAAELEKYATPSTRFSFTLSGATPEDVEEIRLYLTDQENAVVEFIREDEEL